MTLNTQSSADTDKYFFLAPPSSIKKKKIEIGRCEPKIERRHIHVTVQDREGMAGEKKEQKALFSTFGWK